MHTGVHTSNTSFHETEDKYEYVDIYPEHYPCVHFPICGV